MVELRILGTLQVTSPDRPDAQTIAHQPKRAALLAYLAAAAPGRAHRRDQLLALFWPELDDRHARAALSQAIYVLRSMLGNDVITSAGDAMVGLSGHVWCDAVAFEKTLDGGRLAEGLALYRGDLLDGWFLSGAPDFEHWLDRERARLRRRATDAAWSLAESAAAAGAGVEAVRWGVWAADRALTDEVAVRRLMALYASLGDQQAAVRAYKAFATRLQSEYDLEPSPETAALAAALVARRPSTPGDVAPAPWTDAPARTPRPAPPVGRRRRWFAPVLAAVAVLAGASAVTQWRTAPDEPGPTVRLALAFPPDQPLAAGIPGSRIALTPDGSRMVYVGHHNGVQQLLLRSLDRLAVSPVPGTEGGYLPFLSPDGAWIGFVAGNAIRKVPIGGGPSIQVHQVSTNVAGASWAADGTVVFATPAGLWRVPAAGGEAVAVALSDTAGGVRFRWPDVLPGARAALFTRVDASGFSLWIVSLADGVVTPLGLDGTFPRFAEGWVVYGRSDGALLAVPFDPRTLRPTGPVQPVANDLTVGIGGAAGLGVSAAGALAYVPETIGARTLAIVDRSGRPSDVPVPPNRFGSVRLSPDGRWIVTTVSGNGDNSDLWLVDLEQPALRRLTYDSGAVMPAWHPTGTRVAYAAKPAGRGVGWDLRVMTTDGAASDMLQTGAVGQFPQAFTPDGTSLIFERRRPETGRDLWLLSLDGREGPQPWATDVSNEFAADVSPDGQWVAYVSDRSGRNEVFVGRLSAPGGAIQVSTGGGEEPRWSADGRELFYRQDGGLARLAVDPRTLPAIGTPTLLFDDRPYVRSAGSGAYAPFPDGRRFLMIRRGPPRHDVELMLHWRGLAGRRP